jgi:hypothetical protein
MIKTIKILSFLTLTQFSSFGQASLIEKVYHKHFQICCFIGTTEEDLVLSLKNDSTITITIYRTDFKDQYNSVLRQIYFGTFSKVGDSIKAKFINQTSLIKNKSGISQSNTLPNCGIQHLLQKYHCNILLLRIL